MVMHTDDPQINDDARQRHPADEPSPADGTKELLRRNRSRPWRSKLYIGRPWVAITALVVVIGGSAYVYYVEQHFPRDEPTEHSGPNPVQQVGR